MRNLICPLIVGMLTTLAAAADVQVYTFSTMAGTAGSVINSAEGTGSAAQFYAPRGVATDGAGNVFVADSSNNTIRKVTAAGVVTTFAGTAGVQGRTDGTGAAARFLDPYALTADSGGNLYVADTSNNAIRKINAAGVVTTLAGSASGAQGSSDGLGSAAQFREPRGIAVDGAGNVYVADYGNHTVRKISAAGLVTTLAGAAGMPGSVDGNGTSARFRGLAGVAVDGAGNVYVADTDNRTIRKITPGGNVTTLAGTAGMGGNIDASGAAARFGEPRGLAVDTGGTLYVADYGAHTIRKVSAGGTVTTLAGSGAAAGSADGTGAAARFYFPSGVTVDGLGNVYVADTANDTIRKISAAAVVTTLAGLAGRSSSVDGTGSLARFEDPYALVADTGGNVYVADATDHTIRKITPAGVVTTLAGSAGNFGSADGSGSSARFRGPLGLAVDSSGNLYVADTGNSTIRKISATGDVTTLAGVAGSHGSSDGAGSAARFSAPNGIAVDTAGDLYVADTANNTVRKISAAGMVTTLAGTPGAVGLVDGSGSAARFSVVFDVAVDGAGDVYVCDHGNHVIRKITAAGVVTTLAGSGIAGSNDGAGTAASFRYPTGVAVDVAGTVFVADTDNHKIRRISAAGLVSTVGGGSGHGSLDGAGTAALFFNPKDVTLDGSGNLYVADRGNHTIRKGSVAGAAVEFYNSGLKHYFLTADPAEAAAIDAGAAGPGWGRTGGSFKVSATQTGGTAAVCRFYGSPSPGPNSHFFTADAGECAGLRALEAATAESEKKWHYEGSAFFIATPQNGACADGMMPVERYYNDGYARGEDANHRLSSNTAVRTAMEQQGWRYEGVVMCAAP